MPPLDIPAPAALLAAAFAGLLLGKLLAWLVLRARVAVARVEGRAEAQVAMAGLQERVSGLEAERARLDARIADERAQCESVRGDRDAARRDLAALRERLELERRQATEKLALVDEAKARLTEQFRNLATEILEDKSRRFTEQNQQNLGQLLDPLRTKITEFQQKVEQVYDVEGKERAALAASLQQLFALNRQISKEASDLTRALKGSTRTQGNWGEMVLESLLQLAGLVRGQQYEVQESHQREDGSRAQPDVVIRMPEGRFLVVDAKVSLTAYEEYASAEDEVTREQALKRHLESVRTHVKGLAERDYHELHGVASYDFVLMFVALEPAFMLAVTQDRGLFQQAWERNVMLVSPSTLLFVLRTVAQLWRTDDQNRNALEIAKRGAELYDKLAGFAESLDKLGDRLGQAQAEFDSAQKRLVGKGGAVRQAEMLRDLGVKPKKALPERLKAALRDDEADEDADAPDDNG